MNQIHAKIKIIKSNMEGGEREFIITPDGKKNSFNFKKKKN